LTNLGTTTRAIKKILVDFIIMHNSRKISIIARASVANSEGDIAQWKKKGKVDSKGVGKEKEIQATDEKKNFEQ
jgi:hypothetical protein